MVLGLCFGLATTAMAAEGTTEVTVTVNSIDELTVPTSVAITLEAVNATDPSKYAQAEAAEGGQLTYIHNSGTAKKITASATDPQPTTNDITITVKVDGGEEAPEPIVSNGTGQTDVELWTGIAAGTYTKDLTWTAYATIANTPAGDYTFTVTFTATDVEGT